MVSSELVSSELVVSDAKMRKNIVICKKFFFKTLCHFQKTSYFSHGKNVSED